MEYLIAYGFIAEEITERCELEASYTTTRNIQITLSARVNADSEFCSDASERLAAAINDPSSASDDPQIVQVPEVLQFASAAVANLDASFESGRLNGSPVLAALSYFTLLLVAMTIVFL